MDNNVLNIICCDNLVGEIEKALVQMDLKDVKVSNFKSVCHVINEEITAIDPGVEGLLQQENNACKVIMCKLCPMRLHKCFESVETESVETIFHLFLDEKLVDHYTLQGGFIVTNSWLKNYRERMDAIEFKYPGLFEVFRASIQKIIYLDDESNFDETNIMELSNYMDLQYEHIPIGLTHLKLVLTRMREQWKLENEIQRLKEKYNQSAENTANYATMFNMTELLSTATSEREVISRAIDIYKMLFKVNYIKFYPENRLNPDIKWMKEIKDHGYALLQDHKGFAIAIESQGEVLGAFLMRGFFHKENISKYMEFCKSTSNVISMSMSMRHFNEIKYLSNHDGLTGLYNRMYYMSQIEAFKQSKNTSLGIVICDIDNLKETNDRYGHGAGDQLIISMADVLKHTFREEDIISRYGGDEFAVIITHCNDQAIRKYRERIEENTRRVNQDAIEKGIEYTLSFSIGYAIDEEGSQDIKETFRIADQNMYNMKRQKKEEVKKKLREKSYYQ